MAGYRRPVSESERAAAEEARRATLDRLHTQLSDGILALNDPQAWRAWLNFSSQFHRYSTGRVGIFEVRECSPSGLSGLSGGGVVGPGGSGSAGVLDGGRDADPEDAGEHRWWDLAGELIDGGEAHAAGFDADALQSGSHEPPRVQWRAGSPGTGWPWGVLVA